MEVIGIEGPGWMLFAPDRGPDLLLWNIRTLGRAEMWLPASVLECIVGASCRRCEGICGVLPRNS